MNRTTERITSSITSDKSQTLRMSRRGWAIFLALGIIWGMPYLLIRIAINDLHPVLVAAGRTAVGAVVLLPAALHRRTLSEALRQWKWLALYTLAEITAPWVLIGYAESHVPSSTAGLLIAMTPLIAAVIATKLGDDRLSRRRLAGLALGFLGLATIYGLDLGTADAPAVIALMLSACGYAAGPLILARKLSHVQPIAVVTASLIIALIMYSPFIPFYWPAHVSIPSIGAVVCLGVICTALAFVLLLRLVAEVGPTRSTVVAYVNPAVAIALGAALLGEPMTIGMGLSFVLIIAGSILATSNDGSTPR
jgi:drug/metabolite transporter (DMT)-like permease